MEKLTWWQRFFNWFKSNKTLLKLGVKIAAAEFFDKNPKYKVPVQEAINKVHEQVSASTQLSDLPKMLKDALPLNPVEKAIVADFINEVSDSIMTYLIKTSKTVTQSEQVSLILEILGWVEEIAKV